MSVGPSRSISELLCTLALWGAGVLFSLNVANVAVGVLLRYFLGGAPFWTEELSRFLLIWAVFLAGAPALRLGDHMAMGFLSRRFGVLSAPISAAKDASVVVVLSLCVVQGFRHALENHIFRTMGLGIPKSVPLMAVPVGSALMLAVYLLERAYGEAR